MSTSSSSESGPRPSRWKGVLKNLALSALTFLICLGSVEVTLRLAGYGNVEIYQPDPKLYWILKPKQNCFTKIDHKPIHINSRGTRGAEFAVPKPPGTLRVLSLGDSRTFGWGLSDAETYSALLQEQLQAALGPAPRVEVINAGVNAWSFPQLQVFFRERGLAWQPDLVIVGDANLWTQFSEQNDPAFVRQMMSRVRFKNLLRRFALYHYVVEVKLKELYERQRSKFIPVDPTQDQLFKEQQQKDPDAFFRNAIESLCALALSNRIQPVLLYIPNQDALLAPKTNAFTDVLRGKREVSRKLNVPLLDLTPDLQPEAKALYLDADPVHLNAQGNKIIGRRLFEVISPMLKQ